MIYHGNGGTADERAKHYETLNDLAATVKATADGLRPHSREFDTIAVTGLSGLLVGAPVAIRLRKKLCVVRKEDDMSTHSDRVVEGYPGKRFIFLDDFKNSGFTARRVREMVGAERFGSPTMVGSYLYRNHQWSKYTPHIPPVEEPVEEPLLGVVRAINGCKRCHYIINNLGNMDWDYVNSLEHTCDS